MVPESRLETEFRAVVERLAALRDEQRWQFLQSKVQLGTATEAEKSEYSALSSGVSHTP